MSTSIYTDVNGTMIRVQIPDFFEIGIPVKQGEEREHALTNLRWVFNCWLKGIIGSKETGGYSKGAPRRVETNEKIQNVYNELKPHLTENEWDELCHGLLDADTGRAYDLD